MSLFSSARIDHYDPLDGYPNRSRANCEDRSAEGGSSSFSRSSTRGRSIRRKWLRGGEGSHVRVSHDSLGARTAGGPSVVEEWRFSLSTTLHRHLPHPPHILVGGSFSLVPPPITRSQSRGRANPGLTCPRIISWGGVIVKMETTRERLKVSSNRRIG